MRLLFFTHLENAIEALRANRLRTAMTITGVTIGIACMTAALSLANGATQFVNNQISATDNSVAIIRSNSQFTSADSIITDPQGLQGTTTLTEKDAADLSEIKNASAAPMAILHTSMKARDGQIDGQNATLIGTSANFMDVSKLSMKEGQFLSDDDNTSGIVVGHQLAIDLFGSERAIGNVLNIRDQSFTVIGVLRATNEPVNYHGVDFDRSAIISLKSIKGFTQNVAQIQQIIVFANKDQSLSPIIDQTEKILAKNHLNEKDYVVMTGAAVTASSNKFFANTALMISIITGISLLVGGIGIMNIMLVNVAERNREVGIRKAIGATDGQIISQFIIESAIVGLLGGLLGYGLGLAAAFLLGMYLPFSLALQWQTAAISVGLATLIGIVFGIYPAIRAAKKDPIESMLY